MFSDEFSPFGYFDMIKTVDRLSKEYPFIKTGVIGKSVMGKDLPVLRIGRSPEYVLFAGGFHGSEHITVTMLLRFCEELCYAYREDRSIEGLNVRKAMYGRGLVIVPAVNPDGCEISRFGYSATGGSRFIRRISGGDYAHFNANARGVDINHNFNADWENLRNRERESGIVGPARSRFGGFKAESEPETSALAELCRKANFRHALAFHSQGEVIYAPTGDKKPKRSDRMAEIMAASSGYALEEPEGLAVGGGFKDWFIKEFNRPAFTVEIGKGENPLPLSDYSKIYKRIRELLMLSAIM